MQNIYILYRRIAKQDFIGGYQGESLGNLYIINNQLLISSFVDLI